MPSTVASTSDVPGVPLSFSNNFWGREDAGVGPLLDRMHNAKITCDELKAFYNARAALEDDYAKKLLALSRKPLGSGETGTLRASLDVMRGEVENTGKSHATIAQQMKTELEEPLGAFAGGMKERRKIIQTGIERLLKTKQTQTMHVNKTRDRYEQDCLRIKGYLAQGHMVMGQEERKNKAKLEKTQINMASNSNEYESSVKVLEETTGRWNKEWKAACDVSALPLSQDISADNRYRNSRTWKRSDSTSPSRLYGHSRTLPRRSVSLMTPPAKRSDSRLKIARLKRTFCLSSKNVEQVRRFRTHLDTSTSAVVISMIQHLRLLRMRTTQLLNSHERSILRSVLPLPTPRRTNRITILIPSWLSKWVTVEYLLRRWQTTMT
jgi:Fes/CIP4, and EFC/F-BAR homology domain